MHSSEAKVQVCVLGTGSVKTEACEVLTMPRIQVKLASMKVEECILTLLVEHNGGRTAEQLADEINRRSAAEAFPSGELIPEDLSEAHYELMVFNRPGQI